MTHEQLAAALNGREIGEEITREEAATAKTNCLAVAFGYSDDNLELRGYFDDELDCYYGGEWKIGEDGCLEKKNERDEMKLRDAREYIAKEKTALNTLKAKWNDKGNPCWQISIDCPHSTFNVMEDGEVFCVGIVFAIADLKK
jgi:hypothetical protein